MKIPRYMQIYAIIQRRSRYLTSTPYTHIIKMAINLRAKLCKLNDYVNSLRTIEEEEIRKVVLIQVEEAQA